MAEEPLRVERSVVVRCSVDDAFALWTGRMSTWWPILSHSFGKETAVDVSVEPKVGGEIVETIADGDTRSWGTIVEWDPPRRLRHTWHLGFTPDQATDVDVRFDAEADGRTRVTVIQTGFERLGAAAELRRDGNERGWASVMPHFAATANTST
jgi:hypothetical protein